MKLSNLILVGLLFVFFAGCLPAIFLAGCHKDDDGPCLTCPPPRPDTTSHNFTWTIDTLGDGNSSVLYDVAIINDILAYAVGEIYLKDSTGQIDPVAYNLARWNGNQWVIQRIPLQLYNFDCSVAGSYYGRTVAVFAFDDGNMIFTDGADVVRFNGTIYSHLSCSNATRNGAFVKFWGTSINDFYAVGATGTIAHYTNGVWQKLSSGTSLDIHDVWGTVDAPTGLQQVLAVASDRFTRNGVSILQLSPTQVTMLSDSGLPNTSLVGIWSADASSYYVCGDGFYSTNDPKTSWKLVDGVPLIYTEGVRGNSSNDVFVVGDFGLVTHWNGGNWHEYSGNEMNYFQGGYLAVAVRGNTMIAVGSVTNGFNSRAVMLVGRR